MTTYLTYTFDAANDDEAHDIVDNADGSEFVDDGGDWDRGTLYRIEKNGDEKIV
jgi:hypothetical protein